MSELGPEAREILRNGREGDDPSPADRVRIRSAIFAAIAAGAVETAAQSAHAAPVHTTETMGATATVSGAKPVAASLLGSALAKGIFVAIVGAIGVGVFVFWPQAVPHSPPAAPAQIETPIAVLPPIVEPKPEAPAAMNESPAKEDPAPAITAAPVPPKAQLPRTATSALAAPAQEETADSLIAETQRLRDAHGALQGGDPEKALALLSDRAAEAEGQKLREERAAARVLALCKLGRVDEANAEAAVFLDRNPRSPLAERVRKACPTTR